PTSDGATFGEILTEDVGDSRRPAGAGTSLESIDPAFAIHLHRGVRRNQYPISCSVEDTSVLGIEGHDPLVIGADVCPAGERGERAGSAAESTEVAQLDAVHRIDDRKASLVRAGIPTGIHDVNQSVRRHRGTQSRIARPR